MFDFTVYKLCAGLGVIVYILGALLFSVLGYSKEFARNSAKRKGLAYQESALGEFLQSAIWFITVACIAYKLFVLARMKGR